MLKKTIPHRPRRSSLCARESDTICSKNQIREVIKMKRYLLAILCIILALGLCACGKVNDTKTLDVASEIYSQDDIEDAIDTIKKEFFMEWSGCTLTEIYYAGDEYCEDYQDWLYRYDADEVIVLLSSFDVDSSGGDGSLNPNSTYDNWNWILVRSNGGKWQHVDHGY